MPNRNRILPCLTAIPVSPNLPLPRASQPRTHVHKTFGRSGHIRSQRSSMVCALRLGQSRLSCSSISSYLPCGRISRSVCDAVAAFARAFGAFDAEHVELALDVTEDEIGPLRHNVYHPSRDDAAPIFSSARRCRAAMPMVEQVLADQFNAGFVYVVAHCFVVGGSAAVTKLSWPPFQFLSGTCREESL